jgi:hypothetical protein
VKEKKVRVAHKYGVRVLATKHSRFWLCFCHGFAKAIDSNIILCRWCGGAGCCGPGA